ncbi:hypothetical protein BK126_28295 [Paenibacillus sp. FSL H7-0326]|uniref:hypothetical protein n=1 Tax=Paenibacillus sp. FSL H7-0326 TaxID=1921144 RepID=UPI00096FDCD2|nr:hypothetical protein [Paenibacillus sp. FSL H7-0326]OMC62768.1 hypothetical protein BK126_28295 [Paenibacillus sp. FSL H7-0326]
MQEFIIIVLVASFLYPMKNLIGLLTRLGLFGMMAYTLFSASIPNWGDKFFALIILSLPIFLNMLFKFLKLKIIKA